MEEERNIKDDGQFEHLMDSMRGLEDSVMGQLEELSAKMPELYQGYARIVKNTFGAAVNMFALSAIQKSRYMLIGEVLARGIGAFGAYRAAKRHNELLDRYLEVKREHARANIGKVVKMNDEVRRSLPMAEKFFKKGAGLMYDLSNQPEEKVLKIGNLQLRYLTLFRKSLFLLDISTYLMKEYDAWNHGNQTSGFAAPDYYQVNGQIMNILTSGTSPMKAMELAAAKTENFSGADLMLLSDPQLAVFALQGSFSEIDTAKASPAVKCLVEQNEGIRYFESVSAGYIKMARRYPGVRINLICFLALLGSLALTMFYFPPGVFRWIIFGLSVGAIIKIDRKSVMNINIAHVREVDALMKTASEKLKEYCGYVPQPDFDYEQKNKLKETAKTFFG